jgi:hypothetical protein
MSKTREGLPLAAALRVKELHDRSGLSAVGVANQIGVSSSFLTAMIGKDALLERAYRPMPGALAMARLAATYNVSTDYLLGLTDQISPISREYPQELSGMVQRMADDLSFLATRRVVLNGQKPTVNDILAWWRDTGGEVGRGSPMEEQVDVIEIPKHGAQTVKPLRLGAQSLAAQVLMSTDPNKLVRVVDGFDATTRADLVRAYATIDIEDEFRLADMTAKIPGQGGAPDFEQQYWIIRLRGKLLGHETPAVALSFAFE